MENAPNLIQILNEQFAATKARNPAFSLRSFAKKLGLAPSTLSSLLNGQLPLSDRMTERILPRIVLDPRQLAELRLAVQSKAGKEPKTKLKPFTSLDMDQFHLIADWYHFAILSLAETENFDSRPEWIAERLAIPVRVARSAIAKLIRLKLLKHEKTGKLSPTGHQFTIDAKMRSMALRNCNLQNIELSRKALEENEWEDTDYTAMTMAIDPKKIPDARKKIERFRRELCEFLEAGEKKEVYRMLVSLFPLTKIKKELK